MGLKMASDGRWIPAVGTSKWESFRTFGEHREKVAEDKDNSLPLWLRTREVDTGGADEYWEQVAEAKANNVHLWERPKTEDEKAMLTRREISELVRASIRKRDRSFKLECENWIDLFDAIEDRFSSISK